MAVNDWNDALTSPAPALMTGSTAPPKWLPVPGQRTGTEIPVPGAGNTDPSKW